MSETNITPRGKKRKPKVHDDQIGKTFLDKDRRYRGVDQARVIRLIGTARFWPDVMANFSPSKKYRYEVVSSIAHPATVGHRGKVSARILERDYSEVVLTPEGGVIDLEQSVGL